MAGGAILALVVLVVIAFVFAAFCGVIAVGPLRKHGGG
jgi:hypothetical protein